MVDRRTFLSGVAGLGAVTLIGCSEDEPTGPRPTSASPTPSPEQTSADEVNPRVTGTVAGDLNVPWGIAFLPTGDALVAQRDAGSIVRVSPGGRVRNLGEVPGTRGGGEGGLQGLALDPDDDGVLFAFVTTDEDDRVVRIEHDGDRLGRVTPILTGIPAGGFHHGGRLLFDPEGQLFVATGEAGNAPESQKRGSLGGKILRIDRNGDAVDGNPFGNRTWSYGHRNVEGLAFDAEGRLWATEFGANRFDELNLIEEGKNYGWPRFEGKSDDNDYVTPKVTWTTAECSPSGLAIHRSTAFVAALRGECLWAVPLDGTDVGKPRAYFRGKYGRIRTVVVAPDESLWMTTSNTDGRGDPGRNDDRILRVTL